MWSRKAAKFNFYFIRKPGKDWYHFKWGNNTYVFVKCKVKHSLMITFPLRMMTENSVPWAQPTLNVDLVGLNGETFILGPWVSSAMVKCVLTGLVHFQPFLLSCIQLPQLAQNQEKDSTGDCHAHDGINHFS